MLVFPAPDVVGTGSSVGTNIGDIDWTVLRHPWGCTNDPDFLQSLRIRVADPPPSSIIYTTGILTCEKLKMSQYSSQNINSFNTVNVSNNFIVADDRSNILAWLSPLDPKSRHRDIQDRRVESIGEWFLQTEEFRSWHTSSGGGGSDNAVLFCYGDPGVGKTYIR